METGKLRKMLKAPASAAKYAMLLLLGLSVSAQASSVDHFFDGNKLHEICRLNKIAASSYVVGVIDANNHWVVGLRRQGLDIKRLYCLPSQITATQAGDIFCRYLSVNPNKRHFTASIIVNDAFSESFACGQ